MTASERIREARSAKSAETRERLRAVETRIYTLIGNGCALTSAEVDELWHLRETIGESWDAANLRWRTLNEC